jgi:hypothetical protein
MSKGSIDESDRTKCPIPALDQGTKYYSRLSARSALYKDLCLLLDDLREPLQAKQYRELVLEENRLVRSSISARKKLWKELRSRYILDSDHAVFMAFWKEWLLCRGEAERAMTAYGIFALNDRLVSDLGQEWLFPNIRRAPHEIRVEEVLHFIDHKAKLHPEISGWSPETKKRVVQHYLASIRDFGLAQGKVKKTTLRPALYASPVRLLIRALHIAGVKPLDLVQSRLFRLLGLDGPDVMDALGELNRRGDIRFKIQADVIELDVEPGR